MGRAKKSKRQKQSRQKQLGFQEEIYTKAPHSFVFNRGHVGKNVQQLIKDIRHVMEPYTARNLKARKKNVLKDFVNIAGVLNVTHFLMLSKTDVATNLRVVRLPRGPSLTFKVHNYCLCRDVISALKKPNLEQKQFQYHPLLVMKNFSGDQVHMKLISSMFQNMFPSINVNKVDLNKIRRCVLITYDPDTNLIDFRHYNIKVVPVGMTRGVKKLIRTTVPDMGKFKDISEYITQGGNLSESEAELDGPDNEVMLPQDISSRGNIRSTRSAIRLTELGPRLTLQLVKIEEGLCDGKVLFHEFVHKTEQELEDQRSMRTNKKNLKELRKQIQEKNVKKKADVKEAHKQKSLAGMVDQDKTEAGDEKDMEDAEYYKQEVGEDPEPELFSSRGSKRKSRSASHETPNKKRNTNKIPDKKRGMKRSVVEKSNKFRSKDKVGLKSKVPFNKMKGKPGLKTSKKGKPFQREKTNDRKFKQKR